MFSEYLCSTLVSEDFSGAIINEVDDSLDLFFGDEIEVRSLGKISSNHPVCILIATTFPRVIRTSEIDGYL